ncbi:DUF2971 domain-containing protein [Sodalis sp. dw_96]|uniref:DUF2971 domain-containing protein n=1 Tax=Sodalis sp. dw_96 TaxID=2719794 RepID=UPI001BD46344|nr:DUF2971 domain-containing protein [Sodalis sp. dw_96]
MSTNFFRLRSIDNLLDKYDELRRQSIHFSAPEELNDPMEGYRDIFWNGDFVVWKNFFQRYIFCLQTFCYKRAILGETKKILIDEIRFLEDESDLPTDLSRSISLEISKKFFDSKWLMELIIQIANRTTPIRREELSIYLNSSHFFALECIFSVYELHCFIPPRQQIFSDSEKNIKCLLDNNYINSLEQLIKDNDDGGKTLNAFHFARKNSQMQLELINRYNGNINASHFNKNFLLIEFPDKYINKIESLIFPAWYTACFMTDCKNSSAWGHYGDNHKGACLIFETKRIKDDNFLNLNANLSEISSNHGHDYKDYQFHPIKYIPGFSTIDFFRMLKIFPREKVDSQWYNYEGKRSICADDKDQSIEDWRTVYRKEFYRDITKKSKDWEYEKEYRIILSDQFGDFPNSDNRTFSYDFNSLKGIIFGIKTKPEDKLRIIKIIKEKCSVYHRNDFKFYQAFYSSDKNCICYIELGLLKFT